MESATLAKSENKFLAEIRAGLKEIASLHRRNQRMDASIRKSREITRRNLRDIQEVLEDVQRNR